MPYVFEADDEVVVMAVRPSHRSRRVARRRLDDLEATFGRGYLRCNNALRRAAAVTHEMPQGQRLFRSTVLEVLELRAFLEHLCDALRECRRASMAEERVDGLGRTAMDHELPPPRAL